MLPLARLQAFAVRRRRWLYALGGLFVAYSLFGFLVAPRILKAKLEAGLGEALHRPVRLAKVRVNPLVPSVTLEGLDIRAKDGGPWIGCERIYVNARVLPLLWRTISLKELAIVRPSVQVALDAGGRPEFADLFEGPASPEQPETPSKPWTFAIGHFSLTEGRLPFVDHSTQPEFRSELGPLSLSLDGFRTTPGSSGAYSFEATTESGEKLAWSGRIGVSPLASDGTLILGNLDLAKYGPYLRQALDLDLRAGRGDLTAQYRFAWGPAAKVVAVDDARLGLSGLQVANPGSAEPALDLPALQASGIHADLLANRVEVGLLTATGGTATVIRAKDGSLNLARLFAAPPGVKPKPKDPSAKPLALTLDAAAVQGLHLVWQDAVPDRPVDLDLPTVDLKLHGFTLDPKAPAQMELQAAVGQGGTLRLQGPVRLLGVTADLQAEGRGLALAPFDPYLDGPLDLRINRGTLGLKGRLRLAFEGTKRDGLRYAGDAAVDGFEAADARDREVMLRWTRLQLAGLDTATAPLALKLKRLDWTAPEGRVVIAADGTTNVARALKLSPEAPPSPAAAAVTPTPPPAPGAPPLPLAIGLITLKGGRLSFIDRSLSPTAALLLDQLQGRYEKLSTDPAAVSTVDLKGLAGGLAPLTIQGRAMPFRTDQDTDVTVKIDGSDLADFDPYVRKYIGRTVQKGKLHLDAHVAIQHRGLDVLAKAKLDQFYLGDKVDSPDATHLPVKLALALLRDRQGVIDLEVPVQGSLDDPDIKYGKLVWKAIFNLVGKVAASPFTLLGNLFGGGADLSFLAFEPGTSQLSPQAHAKLQGLAKALAERPDLQLEVEGAADPAADGAALRRASLDRLIQATAWARLKRKTGEAAAFTPDADQRAAAVKALFLAAHPPDPKAKAPEPPLPEMEQRLLADQPVDAAALDALAQARAKAALAALQQLQAPQDRVFETRNTREGADTHQARVWFAVK
ncbi:MAG TPA: DUF748 domain-containing protein [Holophagaceae bacterium]|nr:DUF748 domain-containing protein [Holophagaceae bacterium]